MKPEVKKLWRTQRGGSLMEAMLQGRPLTASEKATLEQLKTMDPPVKTVEPRDEREKK